MLQRALGKTFLQLAEAHRAYAAGIAAVAVVELVLGLVAGHLDLFDVSDDDEVPGVDVGRVDRLVLAPQAMRNGAGEAAKHLVARVDEVPVALYVPGAGDVGFHGEMPNHFDFTEPYIIICRFEPCQTASGPSLIT